MKLFALICMFISAFIFTKAETVAEKQANEECSALYPNIKENPIEAFFISIVGGDRAIILDKNISNCYVLCYLEKLKLVDSEGNLQVSSFFNPSSGNQLVFYNNGHIAVVKLFQIFRALRHIEDKCKKATIAYIRYVDTALMLGLAEIIGGTEKGLKDKMNSAFISGKELPEEVIDTIRKYKNKIDKLSSENVQAAINTTKKL